MICVFSRWFWSGMMCCKLLSLSINTDLFCIKMLMWNRPVSWGWRKNVEGMQIVLKYMIWMWWGLIGTGQGFYGLCSMPSSAKCTVTYLSLVHWVLFTSQLYLPLMRIQLLFWPFQPKMTAREICINTWYLLLVSTECTSVPAPLLLLRTALAAEPHWCSESWRGGSSPVLLQGCCSSPLLFTFSVICSAQTSLHIQASWKIPAIDQISGHCPHTRDEDVEQPKHLIILCLCFTALFLSCWCFTRHYPIQGLY